MLGTSFAVSYIILLLIYKLTGRPPEPWGYIIYSIINLLIIVGIIGVGDKTSNNDTMSGFVSKTLGALEKIAQGPIRLETGNKKEKFNPL